MTRPLTVIGLSLIVGSADSGTAEHHHVDSDYHRRTSFTVRLKGRGIEGKFEKIRKQIVTDESGATSYSVSYKDYMTKRNLNTVSKFRAELQKGAKMFIEGKDFDGKDWSDDIKKHFTQARNERPQSCCGNSLPYENHRNRYAVMVA